MASKEIDVGLVWSRVVGQGYEATCQQRPTDTSTERLNTRREGKSSFFFCASWIRHQPLRLGASKYPQLDISNLEHHYTQMAPSS
jgi:hypothetical protein